MMKKKTNWLAIALGATTMIFAGLAVFFGIQYFQDGKMDDLNSEQMNEGMSNDGQDVDSVGAFVNFVDEYIEVKDVMTKIAQNIQGDGTVYVSGGSGLTYQPEGFYANIPIKLNLTTKIASNGEEADLVNMENKMLEAGFELIGKMPIGGAGPTSIAYRNSSNNIVCNTTEGYDQYYMFYYIDLSCAKTNWNLFTDEERNLLNDLATAYRNKTGEYPSLLENDIRITDSEYMPYQTLMVSIEGGTGDFYRTGPNAEWQLFYHGNGAPSCEDYNTDDLKRAYMGRVCHDNMSQIRTVQP